MAQKEVDPAFKAVAGTRPTSGNAWIRVYLSGGIVPLTVLVDKLAVLVPLIGVFFGFGVAFLLSALHLTGNCWFWVILASFFAGWIWAAVTVFRHTEWIY